MSAMDASAHGSDSVKSLKTITERVYRRFPGRQQQIQQLVSLVGLHDAPTPNILVYGPASTGKTSVVRLVLQELQKPFVYVSCTEFSAPRHLLRSIADQLKGKKRGKQDGYAGHSKSELVADFLAELPGVAKNAATKLVVVDQAHRLADQVLLAVLLRLSELAGVRLGVILISRVAWGSRVFSHDTLQDLRPTQISFAAYESKLLASILAINPASGILEQGLEPFSNFMRTEIVPTFSRFTLDLNDTRELVNALFQLYLKPVEDGEVEANDSRKLHSLFQPTLAAAKAGFDSGLGWKGVLADLASSSAMLRKPQLAELDFELPYHSKLLLLAAYICSRTKPTLDRGLFDPTARAGKKRGTHRTLDKQVENAREAALKGPQNFPLERLLAVFWHLVGSEDEGEGPPTSVASGDVLTQLSSLVSLKLLSRASADVLEEAKFRCNIEDNLAAVVAKNLSIRLQDYVRYA